MATEQITLGEVQTGDIVRLYPGHVTNERDEQCPWYANSSHAFLILYRQQDEIGDTRHLVGCWPVAVYDYPDEATTCMGNAPLRFIDRQDVICERLGNLAEMIPDGWGDGCSLPFDKRRKEEPEARGDDEGRRTNSQV